MTTTISAYLIAQTVFWGLVMLVAIGMVLSDLKQAIPHDAKGPRVGAQREFWIYILALFAGMQAIAPFFIYIANKSGMH